MKLSELIKSLNAILDGKGDFDLLGETEVELARCKECGRSRVHQKISFIRQRTHLGTKPPMNMSSELYFSRPYDFGYDYYAQYDLKSIICECGNHWYEKKINDSEK